MRILTQVKLLAPAMLAVGLLFCAVAVNNSTWAEEKEAAGESKVLRHVVMFQFKKDSSEADVQKIVDAFRNLPKRIPGIADFEYGVNNSPEGLNDGLTHCFLVTFKSEEDRAKYLPHPAHEEFVGVLGPHLEKATVIDYWSAE